MLSNVKYPNNMQQVESLHISRDKQSREYEDKAMAMTSKVESLVKFLEEERRIRHQAELDRDIQMREAKTVSSKLFEYRNKVDKYEIDFQSMKE